VIIGPQDSGSLLEQHKHAEKDAYTESERKIAYSCPIVTILD